MVELHPAAKCLKVRLLRQTDLMNHFAAKVRELDGVEPSALAGLGNGDRSPPACEIKFEGAIHGAAPGFARDRSDLRVLRDTAEDTIWVAADRQDVAKSGNVGEKRRPASPEPYGGTTIHDADILAQDRGDERIPCE